MTQNTLLTTADRFNQAQNHAWLAKPPPCQKEPGILPCDAGEKCPLGIVDSPCNYRCLLRAAIKSELKIHEF